MQQFLCFFIFNLILGIFFPLFCIMPWIMHCCMRKHCKSTVEGMQTVYVTEHPLVYVRGVCPNATEFSRVTIPLANTASVIVEPPDMLIIIKPTAPEEILSHPGYSGSLPAHQTFATRSVPIPNVRNAETFAEVIREMIVR